MKLIILSIIFHVLATICLKFGAIHNEEYTIPAIATNTFYLLSLFSLFLQALTWQFTLRKYNLSHAYMYTTLYYPLILLFSYFVFNESITFGNLVGTIIIIIGITFPKALRNKHA
jgi:multidrug transporter EmrE-like cation transporter